MNGFETIETAIEDGILTITLNRPDRLNAFNAPMVHDLIAAFEMADADDAVRAVIVTGAGRAFCAGADLGGGGDTFDFANRPEWLDLGSPVRPDGSVDYGHPGTRDGGGRVTLRMFNCRKPVIGAINGPAVGIGVTMTLPMDFRLASTAARFGFVFARRGITPEAASGWFLPRIVGISQALEWCYSGRVFEADEALRSGLVRSVHAPDALIPAARALAHELTDRSAQVSIAVIRQMMWRMMGAAHPMDAHRLDSRSLWQRGQSADVREGVQSFLEKREAHYPDTVSSGFPDLGDLLDDPSYR